jgi:hypothetical protein
VIIMTLSIWQTRTASIRIFDRVFDRMRQKMTSGLPARTKIARWALKHREHTPIVKRGPVGETGLAGWGLMNSPSQLPVIRRLTSLD